VRVPFDLFDIFFRQTGSAPSSIRGLPHLIELSGVNQQNQDSGNYQNWLRVVFKPMPKWFGVSRSPATKTLKHFLKMLGGCVCIVLAFFAARFALNSSVCIGFIGMAVCIGLTALGAHWLGII
jgi:hypothetical protein